MSLVRAYSRNLGQRSILARKSTFLKKKRHQNFNPPPLYSIPFVSVLHQNKALHNFRKREKGAAFDSQTQYRSTLCSDISDIIYVYLYLSIYIICALCSFIGYLSTVETESQVSNVTNMSL